MLMPEAGHGWLGTEPCPAYAFPNDEEPEVTDENLSSHLAELDLSPSDELTAQANGTEDLFAEADADYEAFWARQARERLTWSKDFDQTLDWSGAPFAKWFVGGELNVAYNCVDRHVEAGNGDRVALHFEGEGGDTRTITYADLLADVCRTANALIELGVKKGDRVAIYLPMIPEAIATMLACARLGAPHSVIFGGFSAEALRTRINDAEAKVVVTADGQWRRGKAGPAQARRRRGPRRWRHPRREGPRRQAHRVRGRVDRGPRRLVARPRRQPEPRAHRRADGRRAPALHPLHVRAPRGSPRASSTRRAAT